MMLREQARPANDVDAAITEALTQDSIEPLLPFEAVIDAVIMGFLREIIASEVGTEHWVRLIHGLEAAGLGSAALAAYSRLIGKCRGQALTLWDRRAPIFKGMAALERRLGMTWAASAHDRVVNRLLGRHNTGGTGPIELEEGEFYVQSCHADPAAYQARLDALGDYSLLHDPLRDPRFTKLNALAPPPEGAAASDDCSFFVVDSAGVPVVQVEADAMGDRYVGCRETAVVLTRLVPDHPGLAEAEDLAVRQLRMMLDWSGCNYLMVERAGGEMLPPALMGWIVNTRASPIQMTAAWIDLSASEEEIERGYRDAHRQSLRWGRRNIRVAGTTRPDAALIAEYEAVHSDGGRVPAVDGPTLARFLDMGRMTLYVGYFEDRPVVTLLSSRHGRTTYYWASAKVLVGNKPIGHVVLHQAIIDAKAEGQDRFYFGLLDTKGNYGAKTRNIALYKSGFASHTQGIIHYGLRI